jgi:predicted transcriptional regulator
MVREKPVKLTKLELEVMGAMWALGSGSVREVQEHLPEPKRPAYTTVQTIIYRLEEKGAVRRVKKVGNAHIFEAVVTRKAAHTRLIDELLNVFGGSPRSLMAQLVETGRLTLADLRHLENTLASVEAQKTQAADGGGSAETRSLRTDKRQTKRTGRKTR